MKNIYKILALWVCWFTGVFYGHCQTQKPTAFNIPVKEFSLTQVKLLDGPFKDAMERDIAWLKSINTDRLLVAFRTTAGLTATVKPYGGWESTNPEFDGIRGHYLGHYLSACAKGYAATGDKELKNRIDYLVGELAKCQDKYGNGYIGAFPESMFDDLNQGKKVRWVPWYTMHKLMAGLYDVYIYGSNIQVYQVLMKLTDWVKKKTDGLSPEAMQQVLKTEQGGMTEVLADIYSVTQRPEHLALAQRFDHHYLLDNMSQQK
ncbi:MAG TPA: beta-L-arabinofuranosidase domain-containing protein, partial [Bacteroidales bacterium]